MGPSLGAVLCHRMCEGGGGDDLGYAAGSEKMLGRAFV